MAGRAEAVGNLGRSTARLLLFRGGAALQSSRRAVLRPRLPPASALPTNELAPDRDRSGAAGAGVDNGAPSNGDDHRQIWPLRSSTPRAARGACWRRGGRRGDRPTAARHAPISWAAKGTRRRAGESPRGPASSRVVLGPDRRARRSRPRLARSGTRGGMEARTACAARALYPLMRAGRLMPTAHGAEPRGRLFCDRAVGSRVGSGAPTSRLPGAGNASPMLSKLCPPRPRSGR